MNDNHATPPARVCPREDPHKAHNWNARLPYHTEVTVWACPGQPG